MKKSTKFVAVVLTVALMSQQLVTNYVFADEVDENQVSAEEIVTDETVAEDTVSTETEESEVSTTEEVVLSEETEELISETAEEVEEEDATETVEELEETDTTDSDSDGITDYYENKFGTDKNSADTDGDGLSDYDEIVTIGSEYVDPTLSDMDQDGVSDADEDADGDGLTNANEIALGTNPKAVDSDSDGLDDAKEVSLGTNPNLADTDSDGASDGFEVNNGFDPLTTNALFDYSVTSEDSVVTVTVSAVGAAVESLAIEVYETTLPEDSVNAYSKVYSVTSDGSFYSGTVTFNDKEVKVIDEPVIFSYNTENVTDTMTALKTNIVGKKATAYITSAGMFVLRSKTEVDDFEEDNETETKDETVVETTDTDAAEGVDLTNATVIDKCPEGEKDSNKDGISDSFTKLLCDGTILSGDLKKVFGDATYKEVQSTDDYDADAILNGDEITLKQTDDGKIYAALSSSPILVDTDDDGINDADDTAPLTTGLAGGVIGSVRIVGRHTSSAIFAEGHSYIVYTSYIDNQTISIDNLYSYYVFNSDYAEAVSENENLLSWSTTVDGDADGNPTDDTAIYRKQVASEYFPQQSTGNSVTLNRGECVSIGNYTMTSYAQSVEDAIFNGESGTMIEVEALKILYSALTGEEVDLEYVLAHYGTLAAKVAAEIYVTGTNPMDGYTDGGIWMNREMFNQKYQYNQYPNEIYETEITAKELSEMLTFYGENSYYSVFNHNCSTVAAGVWNLVAGYERDENDNLVENNGSYVKTKYYIDPTGEDGLAFIDLPAKVCDTLRSFAAAETDENPDCWYVGSDLKIVRGCDVVDTLNTAVNHYDVTEDTSDSSSTTDSSDDSSSKSTSSSSSSSSSESSGSSSGSSSTVAATSETTGTSTSVKTKRVVKTASTETAEEEETEENETEEKDESLPEDESTEIADEEVALSGDNTSSSKKLNGYLATIIAILAALAAGAIVAVKSKKIKK